MLVCLFYWCFLFVIYWICRLSGYRKLTATLIWFMSCQWWCPLISWRRLVAFIQAWLILQMVIQRASAMILLLNWQAWFIHCSKRSKKGYKRWHLWDSVNLFHVLTHYMSPCVETSTCTWIYLCIGMSVPVGDCSCFIIKIKIYALVIWSWHPL